MKMLEAEAEDEQDGGKEATGGSQEVAGEAKGSDGTGSSETGPEPQAAGAEVESPMGPKEGDPRRRDDAGGHPSGKFVCVG